MTTPRRPRRRAQEQPPAEPFYHWFKGPSVRQLYDRLTAVGPDTARVEVRQDGGQMTFRVLGDGDGRESADVQAIDDGADINDSRRCPPICQ